jgi:SAM-dependent methyltransferase
MRNALTRGLARRVMTSGTLRHLLLGQPPGGFDLAGEKQLDWGWVMAKSAGLNGRALDIGAGPSPVPAALQAAGFDTTAIDLEPFQPFLMPGFRVIQGDFLEWDFGNERFDLVILCSAVEHFGLGGRYGAAAENDADLRCMRKVKELLAVDGRVILTLPLGQDYVLAPWHRVYGRERFPRLIDGFHIVEGRALVRTAGGPWQEVPIETGMNHPKTPQRYAVGEFVLQPDS